MVAKSVIACVLVASVLLSALPGHDAAVSSHGRLLKSGAHFALIAGSGTKTITGPSINISGGSKTITKGGAAAAPAAAAAGGDDEEDAPAPAPAPAASGKTKTFTKTGPTVQINGGGVVKNGAFSKTVTGPSATIAGPTFSMSGKH